MDKYVATVVIGFRDWGTERIRRSVQSVLESFDGLSAECIISDYGSADPKPSREVAEDLGAGYVYTPGDPNWSRSRALNAGFAVARGDLYISTDADMLFSPKAMRRIVETAQEAEHCALFLQCRDLPQHMGDQYFSTKTTVDWSELEQAARLRPRWGMGGMMAISADGFAAIRGFDERLHTYGGEDLDFARRAQRAGYRTVWVDEPEVRMYHMWHPPTIRNVEQTQAGREAVAFNKNVVYNDKTYVRNTVRWQFKPEKVPPLISVAIATKDRPELLTESIRAILAQTVQDFEVIVVDDGSRDGSTKSVVDQFDDPRLRYIRQESGGISKARNRALNESRGQFTAVMDDDDLIPPQRFQWQLDSLSAEYVGSVGSFVNFDDKTGNMHLIVSKIPSITQALEQGGAPGHGTWFIRTDVLRTVRYDEGITSGVDNNLFLRMLRSGYKFVHCGKPVLLRRRHSKQVTVVDNQSQSDTAKQSLHFVRFGLTESQVKDLSAQANDAQFPSSGERTDMIREVRPFLPDSLVDRDATITLFEAPSPLPLFDGTPRLKILKRGNVELISQLLVRQASYHDLATLVNIGTQLNVEISRPESDLSEKSSWTVEAISDFLKQTPDGANIEVSYPVTSSVGSELGDADYTMDDGDSIQSIRLRHSNEPTAVELTRRWLHLGQSALEYWS